MASVKKIKVGNKWIGENSPCFVIAEVGSNHNKDFNQALKLIDVAAGAKADAVKFQTFKAKRMYTSKAGVSDYLKLDKSIYQIIEDMEMPEEWIPRLFDYCRKKGIMFLSTPFDEASADLLEPWLPVYKIASYELTHLPLIEHIAKKKKPVILSTGTADLTEIAKSLTAIYKTGNRNVALMQCTACYPAPLDSINLKSILVMKEKFSVPVGLSDHSRAFDVAPMAAVALGANIIEKHFTLDNRLPGPDHRFALEPDELKDMIQKIRDVEKALGEKKKVLHPIERELHHFARRSVFAVKDIHKGERLTAENLAVLRNGKQKPGLAPEKLLSVIGKTAKRNIVEGAAINRGDFS